MDAILFNSQLMQMTLSSLLLTLTLFHLYWRIILPQNLVLKNVKHAALGVLKEDKIHQSTVIVNLMEGELLVLLVLGVHMSYDVTFAEKYDFFNLITSTKEIL